MRLRYLALLGLGGFLLWMSFGSPVPGARIAPMQPDARIPTFQESVANRAELERAQRNGQLAEEPKQRALRGAVINAAARVDASPCDEQGRAALRVAVADFMTYQREIQDKPPAETLVVDGRTIDARGFLNHDAAVASRAAMAAGILPVAAPGGRRAAPGPEGRFVCPQSAQAG